MMEYAITTRGPILCTQHIGTGDINRLSIPVSAKGTVMFGPGDDSFMVFTSIPFNETGTNHSDAIRAMIEECDAGIPLKYVSDLHRGMFVFQGSHNHSDFSMICQNITSAGFVSIAIGNNSSIHAHCHGESMSLGIQSADGDGAFLTSRLNSDM